jgi:acyl CoA:acetate/3-ketoacid CoA transferase beta subunit
LRVDKATGVLTIVECAPGISEEVVRAKTAAPIAAQEIAG